jgi:hypothetical protein
VWVSAGAAFLGGAAVAGIRGSIFTTTLLVLMGLALCGLAWDGRQRNRKARNNHDAAD